MKPRTADKPAVLREPVRRLRGRRLRLIWACDGDLDQVASIERMIADGGMTLGIRRRDR